MLLSCYCYFRLALGMEDPASLQMKCEGMDSRFRRVSAGGLKMVDLPIPFCDYCHATEPLRQPCRPTVTHMGLSENKGYVILGSL